MNSLLLQFWLGVLNCGTDCTVDSPFVVCLHLTQDRDAIGSWSVINELVMLTACQDQICVFVSVLVGHGRDSPWPLAAVSDDVCHLCEDRNVLCFGPRFDEPPPAARERTNASRQQVQGLD